jgi:C_GCAxxG_C_C family probable redox protein
MSEEAWTQVETRVCALMERGFHCSEAFLLCVGEHLLGQVLPMQQRLATGFAGGFGCTYQEACGALSGGVMVLGLIYGRFSPDQDDGQCMQLVERYWKLFEEHFGTTRCQLLREKGFGSDGIRPCCELVNESIRLFRGILPK